MLLPGLQEFSLQEEQLLALAEGQLPLVGSTGAEGSCQDMATPSMENAKSKATSLHHGFNTRTVNSSPGNCEMLKSIEELFFIFSWHCQEGGL